MDTAPPSAGPDPQPDPNQDRPGDTMPARPMPARIAEVLRLAQTLTTYGRHISALISRPTTWFGFVIIARLFGTAAVPAMAAQIQRGIMRAMALEAMLLRRAQRGADLILAPSKTGPRKPRQTTKPPEQASPSTKTPPLTLENLPTQQETQAWVRRRPIGRTIAAIILDLGIAPTLCEGAVWNRVHEAIQAYRGSLTTVMKEVRRRVVQFEAEDSTDNPLPSPDRTPKRMPGIPGVLFTQAATTGPP